MMDKQTFHEWLMPLVKSLLIHHFSFLRQL